MDSTSSIPRDYSSITKNHQAFLAIDDFSDELAKELMAQLKPSEVDIFERLFIADLRSNNSFPIPVWQQCIWSELEVLPIASIGEAVKALRQRGPLWTTYFYAHHRRGALIVDGLAKIKNKPLAFMDPLPTAPLKAFTLLDANHLLISHLPSSPFPLGEVHFQEDKISPPSRAYLKLWEYFTVHAKPPKPKTRVLDLGSCPGGWTWVLQKLGCEVTSVDTAPLDEKVAKLKSIRFLTKDAFKLKPEDIGDVEWLFSDIICDPKRMVELFRYWQKNAPTIQHFIMTIKFKSPTDFEVIDTLRKEPGAKLVHLFHNKHELTFTWSRPKI